MVEHGTPPIHDLSAVIVHHRRHDTIAAVVRGLVAQGVEPSRLVVVDNSEMPDEVEALRAALPSAVLVTVEPNRGYGAAVNAGLGTLRDSGQESLFTLVATHEVRVDEGCLQRLVSALEDPTLAAVGPELLTDGDEVWSMGGILSPTLRMPLHRRAIPLGDDLARPTRCVWLDGAIVVYRTSELPMRPFDESFFLYTEEVDLHLRLGYAGGELAVVPGARAWQQSDGTPPFYFARNLRLLNRRHAGFFGRTVGTSVPIFRRWAGLVASRRWSAAQDVWRGASVRLPRADSRVVMVNPLASALAHYVRETRQVLESTGVSADSIQFPEPSANGGSRIKWVLAYARSLRLARRLGRSMHSTNVLVCWPVLGLLDSLMIRTLAGRGSLVVHDPEPLVRAIGYDRLSAFISKTLSTRVLLVTHSSHAHRSLARSTGLSTEQIEMVPHPILTRPEMAPNAKLAMVSVLGQYKPDRDLDLLREIAAEADSAWRLTVMGRGWPSIPGWEVDARFASEAEFDERLRHSAVVLVPYRRFYQSGVAIRALEVGTAVVGPRESVLADVLGETSSWLADEDAATWLTSIRAAAGSSSADVVAVRDLYTASAVEGWSRLTAGVTNG